MKKIVMAAAVAAMAASFATAEIKTSLNARIGGDVFSHNVGEGTKWLQLANMTGTDAFKFAASTDKAGVTLNYNPILKDGTTGKTFWSAGNGVEYSAWMKFSDNFKFTFGLWKDGVWSAEQCKKDTDDTNWAAAGKYALLYKPDIIEKASTGYWLDSLVDVQNSMLTAAYADIGINENLSLRLALAESGKDFLNDSDKENTASKDNVLKTAPGLALTYKNDSVKAIFDFQMPSVKDIAAGVYVSPLSSKELQAMVGYIFSTNTSDKDDATKKFGVGPAGVTYHGIDLRVRYTGIENLAITNAFNYTMASEDDNVKTVFTKGDAQLWDSVFLTYKLDSNWTITGNVQLDVGMGAGDNEDTVMNLYATPGVMYKLGNEAAVTCGLHIEVKDMTEKLGDKTTSVALPVIFRVKM